MPDAADEKERASWTDDADKSATFAPRSVPTDNLKDYEGWASQTGGWRLLRAAVLGGAALSNEAARLEAAGRVDPNSLLEAGMTFLKVHASLIWVESMLRLQAEAIAGEGRAWQGSAADAFLEKVDSSARYIRAYAERIVGNSATGNTYHVPNQLANAGQMLAYTQYAVSHWEHEYASLARASGSPVGEGGLVAITGSLYEKPMAQAMAAEIDRLAGVYQQVRVDSFTPPADLSPGSNVPPPGAQPPPPGAPPPGGLPAPGAPPPSGLPGGGGGAGGGVGGPGEVPPPAGPPNFDNATGRNTGDLGSVASPVPPPNLGGSGGSGNVPSPLGPSDLGGSGGAGGPNPVSVPPPAPLNLNNAQPPAAPVNPGNPRPPAAPPPVRPGGSLDGGNTGGLGNGPRPPVAPPSLDARNPGGAGGGINPPAGSDRPGGVPAPLPRPSALPAGLGAGAAGPGVNVPNLPGAPNLPGGQGGLNPGGAGAMPPGVPPGAPGGSGGGSGVPDRPDASGLLEGDDAAWSPGGGPVLEPPEVGGFTPPGGVGLQTPSSVGPSTGGGTGLPVGRTLTTAGSPASTAGTGAGSGPMAPGAPASGPQGGSGSGVPDRPDAAGLVEGDAEDWQFDEVDGPDVPTGGTAAGRTAGPAAVAPEVPVGAGPVMAGPPSSGVPGSPGGATSEAKRPEAAGLVTADGVEWGPGSAFAEDISVPQSPLFAVFGGPPPGPAGAGDRPAIPDKGGDGPSRDGKAGPAEPAEPVLDVTAEESPVAAADEVPVGTADAAPVVAAEAVPVVAVEPVTDVAAEPVRAESAEGMRVAADPAVPVPLVPADEVAEEPEPVRPDAAELLVEATGAWTEEAAASPPDDLVPLLDLEQVEEDLAAWDDTDGSWLLGEDPLPHEEPTNRS
ncbi:hypothetical protein [Paractinoplanes brasiliensis]|uniref:Integrin beta 3 n=1 Tax=Paractinoplanes brasiliensis TaxID=52695 RepID=A0A4R6JMJ1_9ACTN|nr:hypothetical protein [Actinoplanes brasiliensis]TDO37087.1 integrin beta 3 [Actinoplanes brasiliensis]GID32219.1 hypothetical protein Abr02nite_72020 [Actinoplanes brasiliensis]